jgi:hypothetical protein
MASGSWLGLAVLFLWSSLSSAAIFREDFATDPASRGWRARGDTELFTWDADARNLRATWDSTRTNTFFHLPLGTLLARSDDFRLAFTLQITELSTGASGGTFQLAIGLIRRADAFKENFFRGAGVNPSHGPRNIVEFDYFPASATITPTLSVVAVATNNLRWATRNLFPFELVHGEPYRVEVSHRAAEGLLALDVSIRGEIFARGTVTIGSGFGDFRLDAFSITSYSGEHQPAGYAGEIQATGSLDDIELEFPDPPDTRITLSVDSQQRQISIPATAGWQPRLLRSEDVVSWTDIPSEVRADAGKWILIDAAPPAPWAAYRIALDRQ